MKAKIFSPKPKIAIDRFLEVLDFFSSTDDEFLVTLDQDSAEIIIVQGQEDLWKFYNPDQLFCVLQIEAETASQTIRPNICVLNNLDLFGEKGVRKFLKDFRRHRTMKGQNPDE